MKMRVGAMSNRFQVTMYANRTTVGGVVNEVAWVYDGWGNVVAEWQSHSGPVTEFTPTVQYVFDDGAVAGEAKYVWLAAVIYPGDRVLEYVQDVGPMTPSGVFLGRIHSISFDGLTNAVYHYRGIGRVLGYDVPAVAGGLAKVQTFDRFDRVTDLCWQVAGADMERFQYTHDRGGRRITRSQPLAPTFSEAYQYDRFSQLNRMDRANADWQTWMLEHAGNWSQWATNGWTQTRQHNIANELIEISQPWVDPTFDGAGNMVTGPKVGQPNKTQYYTWDAWNRLTAVHEKQGQNYPLIAQYGYDGQFKRIWKSTASAGISFFYERWNPIRELVNPVVGNPTTNVYVWGLDLSGTLQGAGGIGGLLSATGLDTNDLSAITLVAADANGNVTDLVGANGAVLVAYQYDPYGRMASAIGSAALIANNRLLFSSKYWDPETGHGYWGYRYYSSTLGRWLSKDLTGSMRRNDLYRFLANRPTDAVDFYGLRVVLSTITGKQTDAFKECGWTYWIEDWVFWDGPVPFGNVQEEDWIFQEMWLKITPRDCKTCEPVTGESVDRHYYEVFEVVPSQKSGYLVVPPHDWWVNDASLDNTYGEFSENYWEGKAYYYTDWPSGVKVPGSGWQLGVNQPWGKDIYGVDATSIVSFGVVPESKAGPLRRKLKIAWNCCYESVDRQTKHQYLKVAM